MFPLSDRVQFSKFLLRIAWMTVLVCLCASPSWTLNFFLLKCNRFRGSGDYEGLEVVIMCAVPCRCSSALESPAWTWWRPSRSTRTQWWVSAGPMVQLMWGGFFFWLQGRPLKSRPSFSPGFCCTLHDACALIISHSFCVLHRSSCLFKIPAIICWGVWRNTRTACVVIMPLRVVNACICNGADVWEGGCPGSPRSLLVTLFLFLIFCFSYFLMPSLSTFVLFSLF